MAVHIYISRYTLTDSRIKIRWAATTYTDPRLIYGKWSVWMDNGLTGCYLWLTIICRILDFPSHISVYIGECISQGRILNTSLY